MILDHNNKFIFIAIPKTASTTIHLAWGHVEHPPPPLYHMKLDECLEQNPQSEDYFKFCFVRNPYERFISTWYNLIDTTAGHTWAKDLLQYETLENFCVNFAKSKWSKWVHFRPQIDYCTVNGKNKMDYIGRQEHFDEHFDTICKKIGVHRPVTGRYRSTPHGTINECLNDEMKDIIFNFYKEDFKAFSYER